MKFSALALTLVVSLANAQNLSGEPPCASTCLVSAISVAGCQPSDVACQCGTGQPAIQTAVTPCLISSCNATDLNLAAQVGLALCSVYSAGLNSTTTTSASASASVASTSSTPLSTTSTSTTSVTAVTTSVPPSSSPAASTSSSAPGPVSSSGAAPGLVAGIGGAVGMLALVAAL